MVRIAMIKITKYIAVVGFLFLLACCNPFADKDYNKLTDAKRASAEHDMAVRAATLNTIDDVRIFMWEFTYIPEPIDWWPTIYVVFARNLSGDCQSAAVLGKWALKQIGISSDIYILSSGGNRSSHVIAVSKDGTIIISNNELLLVADDSQWRDAALNLPGYKPYTSIRKK